VAVDRNLIRRHTGHRLGRSEQRLGSSQVAALGRPPSCLSLLYQSRTEPRCWFEQDQGRRATQRPDITDNYDAQAAAISVGSDSEAPCTAAESGAPSNIYRRPNHPAWERG
jgi:hypothetical protein